MKLIKQSFEILDQQCGLEGIYKQIEIAGRTCYKSEDKITEDSAKEFVDRMIKSGHGAMLEHGTVYLMKESDFISTHINPEEDEKVIEKLIKRKESLFDIINFDLEFSEERAYGRIILPDSANNLGPLYACLIRKKDE